MYRSFHQETVGGLEVGIAGRPRYVTCLSQQVLVVYIEALRPSVLEISEEFAVSIGRAGRRWENFLQVWILHSVFNVIYHLLLYFSANVCHRAGRHTKFSCYFPSWNIIVILVNNPFFLLDRQAWLLERCAQHFSHCCALFAAL
jgi:hypothetical protein